MQTDTPSTNGGDGELHGPGQPVLEVRPVGVHVLGAARDAEREQARGAC